MLGSGRYSDGYDVGSKRPRFMESNPYFAVGGAYHQTYGGGGGYGRGGYSAGGSFSGGGYSAVGSFSGGGSSNVGGNNSSNNGSSAYSFPVVRLRGLPFTCSEIDIFKFFAGLDVVDSLLVNKNGRFSGEAFVVFASPMQAEFALQRDRQNMGRRYVEVFKCKKQDYYHAIASEVSYGGPYENEFHQASSPPVRAKKVFDQMEYTEILKLRGLPYSVTKSEIVDFFGEEFGISEDSVQIAHRPDGKATGDAYVEFESVEVAKKAMSKDRMTIGSRYVELFPSTTDEARRAESRSRH